MSATEFGRGKTIFVLAIVIGCFAVLWPKIFYPMLTASIGNGDSVPVVPRPRKGGASTCCDVISEKDTNAYQVMNEICMHIIRKEQMIQQQQQQQTPPSKSKKGSPPPVKVSTATLCRNEIKQTCGVDIISLQKEDHSITTEYKKSLGQLRTFNTSLCMKMNYGVDFTDIGLQRKFKGPDIVPSHVRQERPFRPGPDMVHPALRERGRGIPTVSIPRRTIEREARPGPVPGMRPPVGGAGHIPTGPKGGGTMGIIMPMYTIGIVCFFLYTIMKILFKKPPEAEQEKPAPQVKDYGLDPEHRKYVLSEEYAEGSDRSLREPYNKDDRDMGIRRRPSAGKSSRFYEDRRRLESPSIIYPTYPSDLETKDSSETTPPSLTSAPETDTPTTTTSTSITKESIENEKQLPDATITDTSVISSAADKKMTDVIEQSSLIAEPPVNVFSPTTDNNDALNISLTHEQPETSSVPLYDDETVESKTEKEIEEEPLVTSKISPKNEAVVQSSKAGLEDRPSLSRDESVASSADTVTAESTPPISEIEAATKKSSSNEIEGITSVRKQSSVVSPSDSGPFSPLAPDQTPNLEGEEFHFFDRTIIIPDYEPADPAAAKLAAEQTGGSSTGQEASPPPFEKEDEEEMPTEEITIVKDVPQDVLDLASQVAEKILDAAKLESIAVDEEADSENFMSVAAPTPSPAGESLSMISEPVSDCSRLSQQPRLSLDTNITALLDSANNAAAVVHEPSTDTTIPLTKSISDDSSAPSVEPSATAPAPPEIQVETPHADQTELNKIAEYLETLNTEPKETEKLAAVPLSDDKPEIISPIVTLAEDAKECAVGAARSSSSGALATKSKIEITPFDDIQPPTSMLDKLGLGDLSDICYVTQPLDENQKGRDRTQFLKSRVEIVSIDESFPVSEPVVSTSLPVEKERKTSDPSVPVADSLLGQAKPPVTESLEEAVKKLRHVPGESFSLEQKEKKAAAQRKASTSSEHSQLTDSPKPSEIDKYVDRVANLQESKKAMIERVMFRSSQSSQGSDPADQQCADQSSNFHGPGLLDSGQIPEIDCHESPPPVNEDTTEDDFLDKMKEVQKWAEKTTTAFSISQGSKDEFDDNQRSSSNDSEKRSGSEEVLSRRDSENVQVMFVESLEKEEPGTTAIYPSTELRRPSEEVVNLVSDLIDQALSVGIRQAAEIVSILHAQETNDLLVRNIGKLDQVLEEIGCGDDSSRSTLDSVLSPELKSEIEDIELLEDFIVEQIADVDNTVEGTGTIESNINDEGQTDIELGSLTKHLGKQFTHQNDKLQGTEFQTSTVIPISSTAADITTTINTETQSIRCPNKETITGTSIDESNLVKKITEECEIISAAIATTTPTHASNTTSSNAPTTVDTCLPLFDPTSSSLPNDSITTPSVPPVIESHDQHEGAKEEVNRQDYVRTEAEEPIFAELDTIQEEIENLSCQLEKLESENFGEIAQPPAEQGESVSLNEPSDEKQDIVNATTSGAPKTVGSLVKKEDEIEIMTENTVTPVENPESLPSMEADNSNKLTDSTTEATKSGYMEGGKQEEQAQLVSVLQSGGESNSEGQKTIAMTVTETVLPLEQETHEVVSEVVVKPEIESVKVNLEEDSQDKKENIALTEVSTADICIQNESVKPDSTCSDDETKNNVIEPSELSPNVEEEQKEQDVVELAPISDKPQQEKVTQESVPQTENIEKESTEQELSSKSDDAQEEPSTKISPTTETNQLESIDQDVQEQVINNILPEANEGKLENAKKEISPKLDDLQEKKAAELIISEENTQNVKAELELSPKLEEIPVKAVAQELSPKPVEIQEETVAQKRSSPVNVLEEMGDKTTPETELSLKSDSTQPSEVTEFQMENVIQQSLPKDKIALETPTQVDIALKTEGQHENTEQELSTKPQNLLDTVGSEIQLKPEDVSQKAEQVVLQKPNNQQEDRVDQEILSEEILESLAQEPDSSVAIESNQNYLVDLKLLPTTKEDANECVEETASILENQQESVQKDILPLSQLPENLPFQQTKIEKVSEVIDKPLEEPTDAKETLASVVQSVEISDDGKEISKEPSERPLQETIPETDIMHVPAEEVISKPEAENVFVTEEPCKGKDKVQLSSESVGEILPTALPKSEEPLKMPIEIASIAIKPEILQESNVLDSQQLSPSTPEEQIVSSAEILEKVVPITEVQKSQQSELELSLNISTESPISLASDHSSTPQLSEEVLICEQSPEVTLSTTEVLSTSNEEDKSEPVVLAEEQLQLSHPPQTVASEDSPTSSTTASISESSILVVSENRILKKLEVPDEPLSTPTEEHMEAVIPPEQSASPVEAQEIQSVQTIETLSSSVAPLRFEILTEPPFPLPSTIITEQIPQSESSTLQSDTENNTLLNTTSSSPLSDTSTVVSSCGLVVDNSSNITGQPQHQSSGAFMALTVELLDEHSPDIFPLPSTNSNMATTTSSTSSPPPTSPLEKAQQSENKELMSSSILNAGVSLSADATDQASPTINASRCTTTTTSGVEVTAEKQATQAPSAVKPTSCPTTTDGTVIQEFTQVDQILSMITDESGDGNVPSSPAPPPPTPAVSSVPPSFPLSSKSDETSTPPQPAQQIAQKDEGVDDEANKESGLRERDARDIEIDMLRKRLEETEAAMERIVSQMGSVTDQLSPSVLAQVLRYRGEDLEKLIASAEKTSAIKKEDLGAVSQTAAQTSSSSIKPAVAREKREKSSEKEVKFKLPPEEVELEEEEEEIEEEEEVEIVRPPTPPKTLSKAKTKSPDSPTSPEPFGHSTTTTTHATLLTSSSSHRTHDELMISGMQTTVAGNAADITVISTSSTNNHNKSPSPAALIADRYNNTTYPSQIITPPPTVSNTPTFSHHEYDLSPTSAQCDDDAKEQRTITETITVVKSHDDNNDQSAAAAIAQAKAAGFSGSSASPTPGVSVVGIEETASLITGERWELNRTPTPTFRQPTPPVPHRPPSPPEQIPSIYLEGPMPVKGQEIVVREAQTEVEGDDYDYDEDYEPSGPVILSGKVTLSVISSIPGGTLSHDEVTEAPSLSLDDRAQAEHSRGRSSASGGRASSRKSVEAEIASAINEQVRGKSDGKKSSNASSPDMDEYEVIGKGGFENDDDEAADVSLDDYLTATDAEQEIEPAQEDTAADISTMDDLKQEQLPKDEE